jgi:hypothetical protein
MEREREREKIPGKSLMQRQCHNRKKGLNPGLGRPQRIVLSPYVGVNLVFTRFKDNPIIPVGVNLVFTRFKDNPIIPVGVNLVFTRDCDTVSSSNPKNKSPMAGLDKSSPYKELRDKKKY